MLIPGKKPLPDILQIVIKEPNMERKKVNIKIKTGITGKYYQELDTTGYYLK